MKCNLRFWTRSAISLLAAIAAVGLTPARAQVPLRKPSGSKLKGVLMPMFQLVKQTHFPVYQLPAALYNFSRAELVTLPKGYAGISKPQNIVYITYGWKRGGLVRLYETTKIKGVSPDKLIRIIEKSGIYHDSYRSPQFVTDGLDKAGVTVVVTSLDPKLLSNAMGLLRASH